MANDNWASLARIGMFIVGREVVPEAEWWAMAPPGVSIHAARVTAGTPWAPWTAGRSGVTLCDDLLRGCRDFAAIGVDVAVLGHSSSSIVGGAGWDEAAIAALGAALGSAVRPTTNGADVRAALAHLGVSRPFLVMPAWMSDGVLAAAARYLEAHGTPASAVWRYRPPAPWDALPPDGLYPAGMATAQETERLMTQVLDHCPASADGVLLAGTGFRCVGIIDALEKRLARPVVTANQASLWNALRLAGVTARREGYGTLLAG
ncbi:hypothetical protein [Phreatobacter sp.]|uniref:aspartate racemase/maleate isomerase family protein n=1 Tax=Phreatobacter sp. TaxID=1966341 RepID=UPI0022BC8A9E|nr:hypothetical protein [Phreatobacter sp.]MCZ8314388.1 hypothetical protein [Phreatobacter sp.]